jgi:hypothetical protein
VKNTLLKVRLLFCHFWVILQKIRPRIFSAAEIFLGPLLCFAAEISAGWQHWMGRAINFLLIYSGQNSLFLLINPAVATASQQKIGNNLFVIAGSLRG